MVLTAAPVMTLEEYTRLFDEKGAFELIEGEIILMPQKKFGDNDLENMLAFAMNAIAIPQKIGRTYVETPFILPDAENPNWVRGSRIPDVMFVRRERRAEYLEGKPDWKNEPLALVPDLVVEIISPTDVYLEVSKKFKRIYRMGSKLFG